MPEILSFIMATEKPVPGLFGRLVLRCQPENADLSRVTSPAGLAMLADHEGDREIGRVLRLEAKNGRITGEAEITETKRSSGYVEELRSGLRRGISPGFLIGATEVQRDPDDEDELLLTVTEFEPYECSTTAIERNPEAAVIGLANRSARTSVSSTAAEIQEKVDAEVKAKVAALSDKAAKTRVEYDQVDEHLDRTYKERAMQLSQKNGQAAAGYHDGKPPKPEPKEAATTPNLSILRYMLFGIVDGEKMSTEGVKEFSGDGGKWSSVRLAFDTSSAYGTIGTGGVDMAGDRYFETSPMRILSLPMQLDNLERDQQVPVLETEPNSAMVPEGAQRLVVTDATFDSTPPKLKPARLQTVFDFSLETHLISPGFETFLMAALMAASDRQMAIQALTGNGTAPNVLGVLSTTGILETTYATADKGSQGSYFDAEDKLATDVPGDRRVWLLAEDLYRTSRRTLRDPGSGHFVVRSWDSRLRVLDGAEAVRTNTLPSGVGVYAEWSAATLAKWEDVVITVNRISKPASIMVTVDRWWNFTAQRPSRFSVLKPAIASYGYSGS